MNLAESRRVAQELLKAQPELKGLFTQVTGKQYPALATLDELAKFHATAAAYGDEKYAGQPELFPDATPAPSNTAPAAIYAHPEAPQAMKAAASSVLNMLEALQSLTAPQTAGVDAEQVRELIRAELAGQKPARIEVKVGNQPPRVVANSYTHLPQVVSALANGVNVFLSGPAGTGKTSIAYAAAEALGIEPAQVQVISCTPYTSKAELFGGLVNPQTGETTAGAFGTAKLIVLDEVTKLHPQTAGLLNFPLSGSQYKDGLTGEIRPYQASIIATANTWGTGIDAQYNGNAKQDDSLTDSRFPVKIFVDYNEDYERQVAPAELVAPFHKLRHAAQANNIARVICTRKLKDLSRLFAADSELWSVPTLLDMLTANWSPNERQTVGLDKIKREAHA